MLTNKMWKEAVDIMKRGELIDSLAKAEIESGHIWSNKELQRATKECNITDPIIRKDIDIKVAEYSNIELQKITKERDSLLNQLTETEVGQREDIKNQILTLIKKQDQIKENIIAMY